MATFMADLRYKQIQEICKLSTNNENQFFHNGKKLGIYRQEHNGLIKILVFHKGNHHSTISIDDLGKTQGIPLALKQPLYLVEDNNTVLGKLTPKNPHQPHHNDIVEWAVDYFKIHNKLPTKVQIYSVEKEEVIINYEIPLFFIEALV